MKKKMIIIGLICLVEFSLTSCQVNWFDKHYDVHWLVIAVPVVIFSFIVWIVAGKYIAAKKYICPQCNRSFNPKWWKSALSVHLGDDRVLKCPHCGRKGFCSVSKNSDE